MKFTSPAVILVSGLLALTGTTNSFAQTSTRARRPAPVIITPAAIPDGSNASRAPFPAQRPFNDVKAPDGQAIDLDVPPNTPATDIPAPPAPRVAVLQRGAPAGSTLTPTGFSGTSVTLDSARIAPGIRSMMMENRDPLLTDLNGRVDAGDRAVNALRINELSMSAEARAQFRAAADTVAERERAVRTSLKAAGKAAPQNWEATRNQLAADYEAYAAAVTQAETAATQLAATR
jgi:hypothetical protein